MPRPSPPPPVRTPPSVFDPEMHEHVVDFQACFHPWLVFMVRVYYCAGTLRSTVSDTQASLQGGLPSHSGRSLSPPGRLPKVQPKP